MSLIKQSQVRSIKNVKKSDKLTRKSKLSDSSYKNSFEIDKFLYLTPKQQLAIMKYKKV